MEKKRCTSFNSSVKIHQDECPHDLVAEIRGKKRPEIVDDEDILTSSVFGHLRYVNLGEFWDVLFSKAMSLPIDGQEVSLSSTLTSQNVRLEAYRTLDVHFWPRHNVWGIPDLVMVFTDTELPPIVVIVENKLWSPKSGHGERDQLMCYLRISDDLKALVPTVPNTRFTAVLYVTPSESLREIEKSVSVYGDTPESRKKLFRIQWQDFNVAIDEFCKIIEAKQGSEWPIQLVLGDVRRFLTSRGLEYFKGFTLVPGIERLRSGCGSFYRRTSLFRGFSAPDRVSDVCVIRGRWANG